MSVQIEVNNAVAAALVALKTENKKLRTEHDKMAATLKVSQEAHSQVVGELKAEIEKLKSDLKKANETKELAIARLVEQIKKEPPTNIQEKWNMKVTQMKAKKVYSRKSEQLNSKSHAAISKDEIHSL